MSLPADRDELKWILARAFDLAWERYSLRGTGTVSDEIARQSLAQYLVAKAKELAKDEVSLGGKRSSTFDFAHPHAIR